MRRCREHGKKSQRGMQLLSRGFGDTGTSRKADLQGKRQKAFGGGGAGRRRWKSLVFRVKTRDRVRGEKRVEKKNLEGSRVSG